jgi:hypothetical protein
MVTIVPLIEGDAFAAGTLWARPSGVRVGTLWARSLTAIKCRSDPSDLLGPPPGRDGVSIAHHEQQETFHCSHSLVLFTHGQSPVPPSVRTKSVPGDARCPMRRELCSLLGMLGKSGI